MITLYTGTPGSGKTLHAVARIWWNLQRANPVISNIRLNEVELGDRKDWYRCFPATAILPADLYRFSADYFAGSRPRENGILLVLDECQLIFSNRDWRRNTEKGWVSFFTQHRKLGFDVILITQYDRMIDKQVRTLVEYESKHRRIDRLPLPWSWIIKIIKGGTFYVRKGWYPLRGEKIDDEVVRVSRKVMRLYDTYDIFEAPGIAPCSAAEASPVLPASEAPKRSGEGGKAAGGSDDLRDIIRKSACYSPGKGGGSAGAGGGRRRDGAVGVADGVRDISLHGGRDADGGAVDGG